MEINKIKWMVGYADGFEIIKSTLSNQYMIRLSSKIQIWCVADIIERWEFYPLLLQRAIEGINTESKYKIIADEVTYTVFENNNPELLIIAELKDGRRKYDETKEQALKYVYEQEATNENKK